MPRYFACARPGLLPFFFVYVVLPEGLRDVSMLRKRLGEGTVILLRDRFLVCLIL